MIDVDFRITCARFELRSITPILVFGLDLINRTPAFAVRNIALNCQIRVEPELRQYAETEREKLVELFGAPERWDDTLRSFIWTRVSLTVPEFSGNASIDLPVPFTFDFDIAATKYFYGIEAGSAPLLFLFSGAVFYSDVDRLQIAPIPWSKQARFLLPTHTFKDMIQHHYTDRVWISLDSSAFERLYAYKRRRQLPRWEDAVDALLSEHSMGSPQ